jgi:hypothetical protein
MSESLPIFLRAHTESTKQSNKDKQKFNKIVEPRWAEHVLVLDCETTTDERQSLTFGAFRYCKLQADGTYECVQEGLFYADNLPDNDPDGLSILRQYCKTARTETPEGYPHRVQLLSRAEFVEQVFWPAIEAGAAVVGFHLVFDLTRIAVACYPARKRNETWSLVLSQDKDPKTGLLRHNPKRWRIIITPKDSKAAFVRLAGTRIRIKGTRQRLIPYREGRFLDLRTLDWALRNKSGSLGSTCRDYKIPGKLDHEPTGRVTWEEIEYCRQDVRATVGLLNAMRKEFGRHPIDLYPEKAFSPASMAKAYLRSMGVVPPPEKFDLPSWVLGAAMQAYYGGRAECRIRHTEVPVMLTDFMSQYPTGNVLMGLWQMVTAERLRIEDCTAEVQALLRSVTLEKTFEQDFWKSLAFFALVRPSETVLPVRADYNGKNSNIGVNPLTSAEPLWYAGPDLVAAMLQSGRPPEVLKAFRVVPEGQQSGLKTVDLRGTVEVDPTKDDFFKKVIEARARVKADKSLDKSERDALSYFLKILANAGSYGLFVEVNIDHVGKPKWINVLSGEATFETSSPVLEPPGKWYCPVFAALITAAGRLLLTILECSVRNEGGSYLFCDTDSMAIVASKSGGLIACDGGPHRLPSGQPAIQALTWEQVKAIVAKFGLLNPYDRDAVRDSILKIEDVNYFDGELRQLFGWGIAAKRYVLFRRTEIGDIDICKATAHGLGFLYSPRQKGDPGGEVAPWVLEAWDWLLRGVLGLPRTAPSWFEHPAMMRVAITTPEVLKSLQARQEGLPYSKRAKPFNFVLLPILNEIDGHPVGADPNKFTLIAPFTKDVGRWYRLWYLNIHDGKWYRLAPANRKRAYEAGAKTRGDYVGEYQWHPEAKSLAPDGGPCDGQTRGLLQRTPVVASGFRFIGKETDRRWEQGEDISIVESEVQEYRPNETARLVTDPELQNEIRDGSIRAVAQTACVSENTVKAARQGKRLRRSIVLKLRKALGELRERAALKRQADGD